MFFFIKQKIQSNTAFFFSKHVQKNQKFAIAVDSLDVVGGVGCIKKTLSWALKLVNNLILFKILGVGSYNMQTIIDFEISIFFS